MPRDLRFQEVEAEVRRLAAEHPDAVYSNREGEDSGDDYDGNHCSYLRGACNGGEGCIFGQALQNLGISKEVLATVEGETASMVLSTIFKVPEFEDPFRRWCDTVQLEQDGGTPWGMAVAVADNVCRQAS